MALNGLLCADVLLRTYTLSQSQICTLAKCCLYQAIVITVTLCCRSLACLYNCARLLAWTQQYEIRWFVIWRNFIFRGIFYIRREKEYICACICSRVLANFLWVLTNETNRIAAEQFATNCSLAYLFRFQETIVATFGKAPKSVTYLRLAFWVMVTEAFFDHNKVPLLTKTLL